MEKVGEVVYVLLLYGTGAAAFIAGFALLAVLFDRIVNGPVEVKVAPWFEVVEEAEEPGEEESEGDAAEQSACVGFSD